MQFPYCFECYLRADDWPTGAGARIAAATGSITSTTSLHMCSTLNALLLAQLMPCSDPCHHSHLTCSRWLLQILAVTSLSAYCPSPPHHHTHTQVLRLHTLLQLLTHLHQACDGRLAWSKAVDAALRSALSKLRTAASAASNSTGAGASPGSSGGASNGGGAADGAGAGDRDAAGGAGAVGDVDERKEVELDPDALMKRRAKQLQPQCLKLLKQLLTTGGKTD